MTCQVNFSPEIIRGDSATRRDGGVDDGGNRTCTVVEPNQMGFLDDGVMRLVHLPKGTYEAARAHFQNGNWTRLKEFPQWGEFYHCSLESRCECRKANLVAFAGFSEPKL